MARSESEGTSRPKKKQRLVDGEEVEPKAEFFCATDDCRKDFIKNGLTSRLLKPRGLSYMVGSDPYVLLTTMSGDLSVCQECTNRNRSAVRVPFLFIALFRHMS